MSCKHTRFYSHVIVNRVMESDNSDVLVGYAADIVVRCDECGLPFEFMGLPMGYSPRKPMVSLDKTELRAPIKPSNDPVEQTKAILNET